MANMNQQCTAPQEPPSGPVNRQRSERQQQLVLMAPLLGHSKARLLLALQQPTTTTALAGLMHTTPSAVSQLLHRLLDAQLVHAQRKGREVFYQLSKKGLELIDLFDA